MCQMTAVGFLLTDNFNAIKRQEEYFGTRRISNRLKRNGKIHEHAEL